jgi:hypothetical protein
MNIDRDFRSRDAREAHQRSEYREGERLDRSDVHKPEGIRLKIVS